jgi:hypothetical protein
MPTRVEHGIEVAGRDIGELRGMGQLRLRVMILVEPRRRVGLGFRRIAPGLSGGRPTAGEARVSSAPASRSA